MTTWPGQKFGSRLSPDGEWVSFVARHTDDYGLWIRRMSQPEPRLVLDPAGTIAGHAWSPDGEEIAVLLVQNDGVYLRSIPSQGGPVRWSMRMKPGFANGTIVRWIGRHLYAEIPRDGLWRIDPEADGCERILPARIAAGTRVGFDVSPVTGRVVFTLHEGNHMSLWTSALDGSDLRAVRPGVDGDDLGRWLGGVEDRVVFSAAGGKRAADLWSVLVGGRAAVRLTFGTGSERIEDVAADGSALTFYETRETASLWLLAAAGGHDPQRLTSENSIDLWPSTDDRGEVIVFQRTDSSTPDLLPYGSRLFELRRRPQSDPEVAPLTAAGGTPLVSPDGRWIAYFRQATPASLDLWMKDAGSEHSQLVAREAAGPRFHMFPLDRAERMAVWRRAGPRLYWVSRHAQHYDVLRWQPGAADAEVCIEDSGASWISDLHVSPDDRRLAYVRAGASANEPAQLRCRDLDGEGDRALHTAAPRDSCRLSCIGWLDERHVLAARVRPNPDWTEDLELASIDLDGESRALGSIEGGFVGTAIPSFDRSTVVLTCAATDDVHNIYAFDIHAARTVRLTDNHLRGISFSGITPLRDGAILYVQHEMNESIWYVRIETPS